MILFPFETSFVSYFWTARIGVDSLEFIYVRVCFVFHSSFLLHHFTLWVLLIRNVHRKRSFDDCCNFCIIRQQIFYLFSSSPPHYLVVFSVNKKCWFYVENMQRAAPPAEILINAYILGFIILCVKTADRCPSSLHFWFRWTDRKVNVTHVLLARYVALLTAHRYIYSTIWSNWGGILFHTSFE